MVTGRNSNFRFGKLNGEGGGGGESLAMFTVNSSGKKKLSQQLIFVKKKQNLLAGKGRSLNLEARSPTTRIKRVRSGYEIRPPLRRTSPLGNRVFNEMICLKERRR